VREMSLPLLDRVSSDDARFCLVPSGELTSESRIPQRLPDSGEQYRFHFDMSKCIGCKCCEVACNEQNGNPPHIRWRRVGEIEAGDYPYAQRFHLSMGCNHCLDAACLRGCPVDAYHKDAATGLVLHSADICIGCQYCTWNCPYGVPQFNEERGVVGKCDMCYGRLTDGREPACVHACPEGAIRVEIVNIAKWKLAYAEAGNAPGMPPADTTLSTTKITVPPNIADNFRKADEYRVRPEHPHWPLIVMLVLTQMSVGTFAVLAAFQAAGSARIGVLAALLVGQLALAASTAHLGRPIHAYRALKMWKRSWLSREVLCFTVFAMASSAFAATLWLDLPGPLVASGFTGAAGIAGIISSAYIYRVPARPAWNSWMTVAEFFLTALLLGPLLAGCFLGPSITGPMRWLAPAAAVAQLLLQLMKLAWLLVSEEPGLRQSGLLLAGILKRKYALRLVLLATTAILASTGASREIYATAFGIALAAEILGRYLFFVSVVPRNIAASFFGPAREAA